MMAPEIAAIDAYPSVPKHRNSIKKSGDTRRSGLRLAQVYRDAAAALSSSVRVWAWFRHRSSQPCRDDLRIR